MRMVESTLLAAVLVSVSTASAAVVNVTDGFIYGHCYTGWNQPQGFSTADIYQQSENGYAYIGSSNDGASITFSTASSATDLGYIIYKFEAPVDYMISQVDVAASRFVGGAGALNVYWRTTDFTSVTDFADWQAAVNSGAGGNGMDFTSTITPNTTTFYLAYAGYNDMPENWYTQLTKDQLTFTVVPIPEPATVMILGGMMAGFTLCRNRRK